MACQFPSEFDGPTQAMICKVARTMSKKCSRISYDDLVQVGILAAWKKLPDFDPARGSFSQFVGMRVRGAMLDELRRGYILSGNCRRGTNERPQPLDNKDTADPCYRDHSAAVDTSFEDREWLWALVCKAFGKLKAVAAVAYLIDELSMREVGKIVKKSEACISGWMAVIVPFVRQQAVRLLGG